jgi:membrane associated rhomboid family serine protease
MLSKLTPVVKNLVIINVLLFLARFAFEGVTAELIGHYPLGADFKIWQVVTHMFMHHDIEHLVFNMFNLVIIGSALESVWGSKRFLQYYILCGLGAFVLFQLAVGYDVFLFTNGSLTTIYPVGKVLGASGSVFGLLFAYGYLFPNRQFDIGFILSFMLLDYVLPVSSLLILGVLMIASRNGVKLYPTIPMKAKYLVVILALMELYLTIANNPNDFVAHIAHLGGMLIGFILIKVWSNSRTNFY